MTEKNYDFRKRLLEVHKSNIRDYNALPQVDEIEINEDWEILIPENAGRVILTAARDLQDYFFTSMGLSLRLRKSLNIKNESENGFNKIIYITKDMSQKYGQCLDTSRSYHFICAENRIVVC